MIYSIIMLSCSHKTHKGPSTETKAHTDACFPLTAPVPPENVQQELPLPASPCLSLPFPASPCPHNPTPHPGRSQCVVNQLHIAFDAACDGPEGEEC